MIGKAKSISHGINLLNYIMGESKNKKHPELIYHIKDNLLPSGLDAMGIWQMMELETAKFKLVKNSLIRIEISPSKEYTQHFTEKDWEDLWNDFVREFDNYENINTKTGKVISPKTNIAASIQSVWLHLESRSRTPHLHGAVCRVDSNGHLNNDHMIHLRANIAAERVAIKRGWKTAKNVHDEKKKKVGDDCISALRKMSSWDWDQYVSNLESMGYKVAARYDENDILHGYSLVKDNASYKASELVKGRKLTVKRLPNTWRALHKKDEVRMKTKNEQHTEQPFAKPILQTPSAPTHDYSQWEGDRVPFTINYDGKESKYYIPEKVLDMFNDEFDYRTIANSDELVNLAVAIFVELIGPHQAPAGGGGGGSQSELPWRDKDEDDLRWARRCMSAATSSLSKRPKTGQKIH